MPIACVQGPSFTQMLLYTSATCAQRLLLCVTTEAALNFGTHTLKHCVCAGSLMNPKLLYTSATRAQRLLLLVTTEAALRRSCTFTQRSDNARNSLLAPRLVHEIIGRNWCMGVVHGCGVVQSMRTTVM